MKDLKKRLKCEKEIEKQLVELYSEFLETRSEKFQGAEEKIVALKEKFPKAPNDLISEVVGLPRYGSSIVEEQVVNVLSKFLREREEKHELEKDKIAALKKNFQATNSQIAEAVGTSRSYVERVVPRNGEAEIWKVGGSVRRKVLKRDNYRCVKCGKRENSLEVHHIISKHFASKGKSKDMGI